MRLIRCFLFMLLVSMTLSVAEGIREQSYSFYSLGKSKPAYDYREKSFTAFFGDSLFDENKDAIILSDSLELNINKRWIPSRS